MANSEHLLVPIKVQALVIDDLVIEKKAIMKIGEQRNVANDGKWSPLGPNYRRLINSLSAPGPKPFYEASREYQGKSTDQLVLAADSPALPAMKDRGVYLHWVLPSGLRHSYTPGSLDFPALPDQWLIVRFWRRGAQPQTKAWFVDSGLVIDSEAPTKPLFAAGGEYKAKQVGKVVRSMSSSPAAFRGRGPSSQPTATSRPARRPPTLERAGAANLEAVMANRCEDEVFTFLILHRRWL